MGLLDAFNSDEGLMGLGLLMAASPSPQNIGIGARLGTALNWVQGQKDSRQDRETQAMRMDAIRQQQAQAQQAQQRDQQFAQALQGGANPAELARYFPDKVDLLKKLADAPNFGRQAVARTIDVELPGGGKGVRQLDQFGAPVTDDMPGYVAPQGVNLGDKYVFTKPVAGQSLQMGMSPSDRDASARGWASNNLANQRFAFDQQGGAAAVRPAKQGPMSVTMQKELLESDDVAQSSKAIISTLQQAKDINKDAYSGYGAKARAVLASNMPWNSKGADATINLDNMMTGQALESLKSVFGGMPTEGERKILLEMQASADKTPAQRQAIMDRAEAAAARRGTFATRKAQAIRNGTYLTDGVSDEPAPSMTPKNQNGWSIQKVD